MPASRQPIERRSTHCNQRSMEHERESSSGCGTAVARKRRGAALPAALQNAGARVPSGISTPIACLLVVLLSVIVALDVAELEEHCDYESFDSRIHHDAAS
jgi:hypothetical protein